MTVIQPNHGWASLDLRGLWDRRELFFFLIWRDLKVRYKQTVFGVLWAVIQPLAMVLVFTLFLGRVAGLGLANVPYALFAFTALVPWTLFAQTLGGSSMSVVNAASLLQKVYFPRLLLPLASAGPYLVDFLVAAVVMFILLAINGVGPALTFVWVLPLTVLVVAAALAVGIGLAALNVRYRDVRQVVPFLTQLWLFASPVAYSSALVPPEYRIAYELNPMVGAIEGFRWALLGGSDPPIRAILISIVVIAVILLTGLAYFRRVERSFADVV